MDTYHNHQWVFGNGFRVKKKKKKIEIGHKKIQESNQILTVM